MKMESLVVEKRKNNVLKCCACSHRCTIADGQTGICGVRANDNGEFNLLVYGKPCAVAIDPIEKKPLFHFLPGSTSFSLGTFGCNFACEFCQNWDMSQAPREAMARDPKVWREYFERLIDTQHTLTPEEAVRIAIAEKCKSVSYTYNEPTIFTEYALDIMKEAEKRKSGLKHVYVTNGYESEECWKLLKGKLDAANIDLKAFNDKFYRKTCKSSLEPVLQSIKTAKQLGIWIEVTTLLIAGGNDSPEELKAEAEWLAAIDREMPWHVTAFHPEYKMLDKPPTPPESLLKAREIGIDAGLKHVYTGNVPLAYADYESTKCPKCKKTIVKRSGISLSENNIIDGKCRFCKNKIKGVWE
jgi:pyruvate formate lyase activating enzyme